MVRFGIGIFVISCTPLDFYSRQQAPGSLKRTGESWPRILCSHDSVHSCCSPVHSCWRIRILQILSPNLAHPIVSFRAWPSSATSSKWVPPVVHSFPSMLYKNLKQKKCEYLRLLKINLIWLTLFGYNISAQLFNTPFLGNVRLQLVVYLHKLQFRALVLKHWWIEILRVLFVAAVLLGSLRVLIVYIGVESDASLSPVLLL